MFGSSCRRPLHTVVVACFIFCLSTRVPIVLSCANGWDHAAIVDGQCVFGGSIVLLVEACATFSTFHVCIASLSHQKPSLYGFPVAAGSDGVYFPALILYLISRNTRGSFLWVLKLG